MAIRSSVECTNKRQPNEVKYEHGETNKLRFVIILRQFPRLESHKRAKQAEEDDESI